MKKTLQLLLLLPAICISAQSNLPAGEWIGFLDADIRSNLIVYTESLNEDTLFENLYEKNNFKPGVSYYWDGSAWQPQDDSYQMPPFYLSLKTDDKAVIIFGMNGDQMSSGYDIFTEDGWAHVKYNMKYIPGTDRMFFDGDNNRFILLKENVPWIFYME